MRPELQQLIGALIVPLRNQIANLAARVVIKVIDNTPTMQRVQALAEEGTIEDVEHFQPYGLSSVPVAGAEGVILCAGGDRAVPIAVVVSEPGTRPAGQASGEVALYHRDGHIIQLRDNGDIEIECGAGQKIYLNDGSGGVALATEPELQKIRDELHLHEHQYVAPLHPSLVQPGITTGGPVVTSPTGTQVVRGK